MNLDQTADKITPSTNTLDLSGATGALNHPTGTTAQRPASPVVGAQRWNTTLSAMEVYVGSSTWQVIASTNYTASYLVVAGGASGARAGGNSLSPGGGGGAGGVRRILHRCQPPDQ